MSQILTPPQLAQRWNTKADSVRALLAAGKLRGFKVGRSHWRITLAEVERFERGEEPSSQQLPKPRQSRRRRRDFPAGPF